MAFYYKKFKSLRKDIGMSQLEVGQKLGLAKSTIAMYESGKRTPDFETIEAICDLFNVNMSELSDSKLATKYENLNAVQPAFHLTPNDSKKKSIVYDRIHDVQPRAVHERNITVNTCGIGKIIKKNRLKLKLTLDDVANAVGVTKSTVQRWESGEISNMRRDKIDLLSKILQVSPLILLGNDSTTINPPPAELPELTAKDERDIVKEIEDIIQHVDTTAAVGGEMTPEGEDKELLKSSLTQAVTLAKRIAKQKYTPKKYRK